MPKISQDPVLAQSIKLGRGGGGGMFISTINPYTIYHPKCVLPFYLKYPSFAPATKGTAKAAPLIDILGANWENLGCPYTSATFFPDTTPFLLSILTSFSPQLYTSFLTCAPALTSLIILDSTLFCAESRTTP